MNNRIPEFITYSQVQSGPFIYNNTLRKKPLNYLTLTIQDLQESATSNKVLDFVSRAQNQGQYVFFDVPIGVDMSVFKLTDNILKSKYVAEDQSQSYITFFTGGQPYVLNNVKFNMLWKDDEQYKNYLIVKSPINNTVDYFPLKIMSAAEMIGLVGFSTTIQKQEFDYQPIHYPIETLYQ